MAADIMIPGAQKRFFPRRGNPFASSTVGGKPALITSTNRKLILHTTEGVGWTDYGENHTNPNFTIDPRTGAIQQHIPLQYGARAVQEPTMGNPITNVSGVQVEIIAITATSWAKKINREDLLVANFGDREYANLAKAFKVVQDLMNIPNVTTVAWPLGLAGPTGKYPDGPYGVKGAYRLSLADWNAARGFVAHFHCPAPNVHSDVGCLDINRLIAAIAKLRQVNPPKPVTPPKPTPPVVHVPFPIKVGEWYGLDDHTTRSHSGARSADQAAIRRIQKYVGVSQDGSFGPKTDAAVRAKQKATKGLLVDGRVGAATWQAWF